MVLPPHHLTLSHSHTLCLYLSQRCPSSYLFPGILAAEGLGNYKYSRQTRREQKQELSKEHYRTKIAELSGTELAIQPDNVTFKANLKTPQRMRYATNHRQETKPTRRQKYDKNIIWSVQSLPKPRKYGTNSRRYPAAEPRVQVTQRFASHSIDTSGIPLSPQSSRFYG